MKRFYILDMDGTLCDSMELWRKESVHVPDFRDADVVAKVFDVMREHYRNDIKLKDGALEFLERSRKRGIKMCIATGTRRDVALPFLEKTGILDFMEFYIDSFDVRAFKEKPDIYLKAAALLGAKTEECVVFEDAEYCARTAKNAGFYVVGIADTVALREGCTRLFSDLYIENWGEFDENKIPDLITEVTRQ